MEELTALPGVGRKPPTSSWGMCLFGQEGYVCDTHCIRITGGWVSLTVQGSPPGGTAAAPEHPAQGVQQLLPPAGPLRPGHLHCPVPRCEGCPWPGTATRPRLPKSNCSKAPRQMAQAFFCAGTHICRTLSYTVMEPNSREHRRHYGRTDKRMIQQLKANPAMLHP
jgi:hypothetical protein